MEPTGLKIGESIIARILKKLDIIWIDFSTHVLLNTWPNRKMNVGREM